MEAKDIKWCPQHGYPLPCYKCGMPLSQPQQKEIYELGFKAGQEDVCTVSVSEIYDKGYKAGREVQAASDKPLMANIQHAAFVSGKQSGIRKAVNHLKMHYFIDVPEDTIKEIEGGS